MPRRRRLLLAVIVSALLAALVVLAVRSLREEPAVGSKAPPSSAQPQAAASSEPPAGVGGQVSWSLDYESSVARARAEGLPVLIDFFADWCSPCKELDEITYRDPRVVEAARRFVTLKVDGTEEDDTVDALYERYGVQGLPTLVFIDSKGKILEEPRALGFVDGDELLEMMARVR